MTGASILAKSVANHSEITLTVGDTSRLYILLSLKRQFVIFVINDIKIGTVCWITSVWNTGPIVITGDSLRPSNECDCFCNEEINIKVFLFDLDLNQTISEMISQYGEGFVCLVCQKTFAVRCNAKSHVEARHLQAEITGISCDICGFVSKTRDSYRKHLKKHTKPSLYWLNLTNKILEYTTHSVSLLKIFTSLGSSAESDGFVAEEYIVLGEGEGSLKHRCSICLKGFSLRHQAKRHVLSQHSGVQKPVQCDVCFGSFKNKESLAGHKRSAHGIYCKDSQRYNQLMWLIIDSKNWK